MASEVVIACLRRMFSAFNGVPREVLYDFFPGNRIVHAALRNTAEHTEGVAMRIEQHLVRLQMIRVQAKCAAIAQLEMRHLRLGRLAADAYPVFAPVELERLTGRKGKRYKGAATGAVGPFAFPLLPVTGMSRQSPVRPSRGAAASGSVVACGRGRLLAPATGRASSDTHQAYWRCS